jgi:hypothetical protein
MDIVPQIQRTRDTHHRDEGQPQRPHDVAGM